MANNADQVARALESINGELDTLTHAELLELGHAATTMILARTKKGIDASGRPFKPYTEAYAIERAKAGYSKSPPDLVRTGHMLGAMMPTVTGFHEVTISFASELEAKKAAAHNYGGGHEPRRNFFDIKLPEELDALSSMIGADIRKRVEKKLK